MLYYTSIHNDVG